MTEKLARKSAAIGFASLVLLAAASAPARAQVRPETVSWTLSAPSAKAIKPGSRLALTLRGDVLDGWHVYGLRQQPNGPTPLVVTLAPGDVASPDGAPVGGRPVKSHDPSFDLDTEYYAKPFTVTVPVRIGARLADGRQLIPVNVRFQTCNGEICQPPKTVRLSVPVTVKRNG